MIAVAIIGIVVAGAGFAGGRQRELAKEELQRERALQLLEYRVAVLGSGGTSAASTETALTEYLPDAKVDVRVRGNLATFEVTWKGPRGDRKTRSLTAFSRGNR